MATRVAGHQHVNLLSDVHEAKMIVPKDVAPNPNDLSRLGVQLHPSSVPDHVEFTLDGLRVWLPFSGAAQPQPVAHHGDESFSTKEDDIDAGAVGPHGPWKRLSRLASLNAVTGAKFDLDVDNIAAHEHRVQAIVHLSGGSIECLRSAKALGDAFVEFFTRNTGTVALQPFSEDVDYYATPDGAGQVEIGLGLLSDATPQIKFSVPADRAIVLVSLPPANVKGNTLNHYRHYYSLMEPIAENDQPFLRVLAFWDGARLRHTMPPPQWVPPGMKTPPAIFTTGGTCSCAVAQVFRKRTLRSSPAETPAQTT